MPETTEQSQQDEKDGADNSDHENQSVGKSNLVEDDETKESVNEGTTTESTPKVFHAAGVGATMVHEARGGGAVNKSGGVYALSEQRKQVGKQADSTTASGTAATGIVWKSKKTTASAGSGAVNKSGGVYALSEQRQQVGKQDDSTTFSGTAAAINNHSAVLHHKLFIADRSVRRQEARTSNSSSNRNNLRAEENANDPVDNDKTNRSGVLLTADLVDEEAHRRELEEDMMAAAREQLIAEAVQASEVVAAPDEPAEIAQTQRERRYRPRCFWFFCCLLTALVIIISVVVLTALLTTKDDGSNADDDSNTVFETVETQGTPVEPLNAMISTSFPPSVAPSISPQNINNDYCQDAINITIDGGIVRGNLFNTTIDEIYLTYTTQFASSQNRYPGYGRWYSFLGNGLDVTIQQLNGSLQAREYLVFTGPCSGKSPAMDTTVVNADDFNLNGIRSTFKTNINTKYWLLVFCYDSFEECYNYDGGSLPFNLSVPYEFYLGSQAYCDFASDLSTLQETSNLLSYGRISPNQQSCGSASAPLGKGIWYFIMGANKSYRLSTEGSQNLDTQISIFQGDCGNDALECVAGNDNAPNFYDGHSTVHFAGFEGVKYYVLVHGANIDVIGSFVLSVEEYPLNDISSGAIDLNVTAAQTNNSIIFVEGSTENATAEEVELSSLCKPLSFESPISVWYRIYGTGQNVSLCKGRQSAPLKTSFRDSTRANQCYDSSFCIQITMTVESASLPVESVSERRLCVNVFTQNYLGDFECFQATSYDCMSSLSFFAQAGMPYLLMVGEATDTTGDTFHLTIEILVADNETL